ncbi:MAG TPA: thioredoxin domain-containing protein [Opitutaceae bacterium]
MIRRSFLALLAGASILAAPLQSRADDTHSKAAEPVTISHGSKVQIADYLVPGKTTVVDFYSEHCPTCKALYPGVKKLHATRGDIAVVFVDIDRPGSKGIDWDSPVSKQYDVPSTGTPLFKVYGPDGRLQVERKQGYTLVTRWLN